MNPWVSATFVALALLMFVWSVTGTIALRNGLELLLFLSLPWLGVDWPALWRSLRQPVVLLLGALSLWIVFHNLVLAWEPERAWYESLQWFKAGLCFVLGAALACAPRQAGALDRWRFWALALLAAWALHLLLNVLLKDWSLPPGTAMQAATRVGSRDMVSYLGTGLLALLLADAVARFAGGLRMLPVSARVLWGAIIACIVLTLATLTRNALPVMAAEIGLAVVALIGLAATRRQRLHCTGLAAAVAALIISAMAVNLAMDQRWANFSDSVRIGWDIDGHDWWLDQVANPRPHNDQGVPVDHSAYSRAAWLRGAVRMIGEYPLGTGYDRNALRRALARSYGPSAHAPGHAHAGLLDFTLATGIPGGLMLTGALIWLSVLGWRRWRVTRDAAGLALAIFCLSYLLRAAVDGIVRDHMLEQAFFVIGLLFAASLAGAQEQKA